MDPSDVDPGLLDLLAELCSTSFCLLISLTIVVAQAMVVVMSVCAWQHPKRTLRRGKPSLSPQALRRCLAAGTTCCTYQRLEVCR